MENNRQVRVLMVEDDYLVSELIKATLAELDYVVAGEATSGLEALEMTKNLKPDVILMDIKMPDMNGLEAAQQIHEQCPTPVVVLTAYDTKDLVEQAREVGVSAYLTKPPSAQEIERAILIALARFEDVMALRRLNAELQARNQELDTFSYTVAHQLKNAASLVSTFGKILREQITLPEQAQPYLDGMIESGHKMNNIISELQFLAGIRTDDIPLKPLDMGQIVDEVQDYLRYMIAEHQATLSMPADWPVALGYGPWVEQVWVNYIGNAIKHGGRPPRVKVGAAPQRDGMVCFWVRDNGPGLTPEDQIRLFEPFTQLSKTQAQGQGLGLSIARHIVEKLGGKVSVESAGLPGQGATFSFTLPAYG
jgi:signal transduction histidine kinase